MKKNTNQLLAAIASAALGMIFTIGAGAQTVTTAPGDLILSFRATGGQGSATNLEVDLGSLSNYTSLAPGTVVSLTSRISLSDLSTTYGNTWNTRSDLLWSVAGTSGSTGAGGQPVNTLFGTSVDTSAGFGSGVVYQRLTSGTQGSAAGLINTEQGALNGAPVAGTAFSSKKNSGDGGSYSDSITNSGLAIVAYNNGNQSGWGSPGGSPFENNTNLAGGPAQSDLYQLVPVARTAANGTDLGTFQLFSNGTFQFVTPSAVPEPSTTVSLLLGGLVMLAYAFRRRQIRKA